MRTDSVPVLMCNGNCGSKTNDQQSGRLHPGRTGICRACFAQDLLGRAPALAAVAAYAQTLAQFAQAAHAKLGTLANLALGHRVADADVHGKDVKSTN